jgi:hypothetical protein
VLIIPRAWVRAPPAPQPGVPLAPGTRVGLMAFAAGAGLSAVLGRCLPGRPHRCSRATGAARSSADHTAARCVRPLCRMRQAARHLGRLNELDPASAQTYGQESPCCWPGTRPVFSRTDYGARGRWCGSGVAGVALLRPAIRGAGGIARRDRTERPCCRPHALAADICPSAACTEAFPHNTAECRGAASARRRTGSVT